MTGRFADVRSAKTVAALRPKFADAAAGMGLTDLDAAALKLRTPQRLTQLVAGWSYQHRTPPDGVAFGSRHDDSMQMWAIFEQPGEDDAGSLVRHSHPALAGYRANASGEIRRGTGPTGV